MSSPTFTPVPATRADGNPNPPVDMNNTSNQLAAIGAGYSVMNTTYGGGADPSGLTDSTAQIGSAVAAAHAAQMPVLIPAGTFAVDAALNWKLPGLQVIGAGSGNTKILQKTANTPILQLAGQGQLIQGLNLSYGSQQASGQTSANNIQFGDDSVGSCFESAFRDLYCELGYTPITVNPALVTSAGLFSCLFENIHILGYFQHAIGLAGNAGGGNANCTGCVWNNTYVHNNFLGTAVTGSNSYPVFLESWDEIVFNQLNIEHGESFIEDLIGLAAVGNCVINGLHVESMQLSGAAGNAAYINCDSRSGVIVNGLSVRFSTMSGTVSNSAVRFSGSTPSAATITGFNEPADNTFSGAHAYADFGTVSSCTAQVSNVLVSQTSANTLNQGAGNYFQVGPPQIYDGMFGDGADGAATLDGTATVAWASLAGSTYTMSRAAHLTGLTINSGVTLKPSGNPVYCRGPVLCAGTITADGNNGSGATGGGSSGSSVYVGGRIGPNGGTGIGAVTPPATADGTVGMGAGGAGGAGSSGAGGAGGTTVTTGTYYFRNPMAALTGIITVAASNVLTGGAAGGAGAGDGANSGGGGGGGGGPIVIFAYSFTNTGTITAKGGTGGAASAGNCGGGGGGTGGLVLVYTLTAWTQSGTLTLTAGSGGAKTGSGVAGSSGSAGFSLNEVVV